MKKIIKTIITVLFGSAVFWLLHTNLSINSGIPGVTISFAYPFLIFMAILFGPIPGALIGFAGHTAASAGGFFLWNQIIASALTGFLTGSLRHKVIGEDGRLMPNWSFSILYIQILINGLVWGVFVPVTEIILYKGTPDIAFLKGISAAVANMILSVVFGSFELLLYSLFHGMKNKKR